MKKFLKIVTVIGVLAALLGVFGSVAAAAATPETTTAAEATETTQATTDQSATGNKAIAAAAGAVGMGLAIAKSAEGISRQPEAEGKIRTSLMLGLVFIETAIIYALIIAILIIFVL